MEEKQHAGLLYSCLEKRTFAEKLPEPSEVQKLQQELDALTVRACDRALSLDAAFEIAIQLEATEMDDMCARLTTPLQDFGHVRSRKLDLSSGRHFRKLKDAAERFDASPSVRSRLAALV